MADKFEDDPGYIYLQVTREEKAKSLSRAYDSKKNCWVSDPEEGLDIQIIYLHSKSFSLFVF